MTYRIPRRWTVAEYQCIAERGVFGPEERLELIQGEIFRKVPLTPFISVAVDVTASALCRAFVRSECFIRQRNLVVISGDSQPEPNVAVIQGLIRRYSARHPEAGDILLLAEVSDAGLDFDRSVKSAIYAMAGIREYWIVNIPERQLEVYRDATNGA